ncbi:MFS transporter [Methylosinus sp. Sm6]|uniref:MFS transporter n=1 Tax=Methylosinus sp. Sm6 TaxID=2866948 RepID=UPI001C9918E6|nr:MFS transporter [Methylosinus sp. Sm6]MBY6242329.1 MFS transporter [Methylosinus sp. Sm6]
MMRPTSLTEFSLSATGVLIVSIIGVMLGPTGFMLNSFGLFIQPMSDEFGWDRTEASSMITLFGLSVALGSPVKGWLMDRYGLRPMLLLLTFLLALAISALASAENGLAIRSLFCFIGLLAPGNLPYGKIIGMWFTHRRGLAYGLFGLGFGLGGVFSLVVGRWCVDTFGWRQSYLFYGGAELVVAAPLIWLLFHEPRRPWSTADDRPLPDAHSGDTLVEAWLSARFWLVIGNLVLTVFVMSGLITHGVPLLIERGLSRTDAAATFSMLWIGMSLSQPVLGHLLDRFDTPRIVLPFAAVALAGLLLLQAGPENTLLPLAILLVGFGGGGESGSTQYFVSRYCGLRRFGVIYGSIQPFTFALSIGLGSYLLGYLFDQHGSYVAALWALDAALVVAIGLLLLLGPYRYELRRPMDGCGPFPQPAPTDVEQVEVEGEGEMRRTDHMREHRSLTR